MLIRRDVRSKVVGVFILGLLLLLGGCAAPGPGGGYRMMHQQEDAGNKGRLSLFLNLQETDGPDLSMQISAVDMLSESGAWQNYYSGTISADTRDIRGGQQFLARLALPPDTYTRIRLVLGENRQGNGDANESPLSAKAPEVILELRDKLRVAEGDSRSLFITWDTKASVKEGVFEPVLLVAARLKKLISDVAYVACPEIDTLFMLSLDKNRVIDSIGIPGGPIQVLQSRLFGRERVYVLTGSELIGFSTAANEIVERNNLSMTGRAVHMAISPNGQWGYISDQQRGNVLRMDMYSGTIDNQVRLNYAPNYIVYQEKLNLLAVSVGIAQNVIILDPETLQVIGTISTGVDPDGLLSWEDGLLYIAETGSNSIMIYDFANNSMAKRISVGFLPDRITRSRSFIYVANPGSRSISVLLPGLHGVSRTISFPDGPLEMAYSEQHGWLYVGSQEGENIAVIDPITNEITGTIELGAVPAGILVLE